VPLSGPAAAAWGKMPPNSCGEITHIGRHTKQKIDHACDKQAAGEEARSEIETRRPTMRAGMGNRASKNLQSHGVARPAQSRTALKLPKGSQSLSRLPRFDTGCAPGRGARSDQADPQARVPSAAFKGFCVWLRLLPCSRFTACSRLASFPPLPRWLLLNEEEHSNSLY